MTDINKLTKRPKVFHALCGLTPDQFLKLLLEIKPLWQASEHRRKNWKGRQRAIGGGRTPKLSLPQSLFMLLLYYRTYTNQSFVGLVAGIDDSNVGRYINRLEPILSKKFKIPFQKIDLTEDEIWDMIVDATEQETQKRKGSGYSGKKKKRTIKTQIYVNKEGVIKSVSVSVPGYIHDKKLYDQSHIFARNRRGSPVRVKVKGDLGYLGTECDTPIKKQPGRPLMMHEEYYNRDHARKRIQVEHTFAHLKKFHILADKFRNKINRYNLIFRNIAGIRNFIIASA